MARGGRRHRWARGFLQGTALAAVVSLAHAQQAQLPGADVYLDLRTGVVVSDNLERTRDPTGTSTILNTDLRLGFDSVTKIQRFTAEIGTTLETGYRPDRPGDDTAARNPFLRFGYTRQSPDAALSFSGSWRESDVGFQTFTDELTGQDLVVDGGVRRDWQLQFGLETGQRAPVGLGVELRYGEALFSDTQDPALFDRTTLSVDTRLRFSVNRTTDLRLVAAYSKRQDEDAGETEERNARVGFGLSTRLRSGLIFDAEVRQALNEVERTENGSRGVTKREGPTVALSLTQARPNGVIAVAARSQLTSSGTSTTLSLRRRLELRDGALDARIGTTVTSDGGLQAVGDLSYQRKLRNGGIDASLSRTVATDADSEDFVSNRLSVGWSRDLSKIDGLRLGLSFSDVDVIDENGTDRQNASLELAYQRQLTREWNLRAGYRHNIARQSGLNPVIENRVFADIGRRFSLRP